AGATIMSYSKYKKSAADFAQAKSDEESMRQRYDGAVNEIVMIQDSLNTIMLGGESVLPEGRQAEEPGTLHDTVLSRIATVKPSGVVVAEGGVLGVGKTLKPSGQFDESKFTALNTDQETVIAIPAHNAQILSPQPVSSYTLHIIGKDQMELRITNPSEFRKV